MKTALVVASFSLRKGGAKYTQAPSVPLSNTLGNP